jgi:hypothetical protein
MGRGMRPILPTGEAGEAPPPDPSGMPTFVAMGTMAAEGGADSTPGLPVGWAENDIFLLYVESSNQPGATPAGYTVVPGSPQTGGTAGAANGLGLEVFWKRAGASESAPTVVNRGDHQVCVIAAVRGCPTTGNPWDVIVAGVDTAASNTSLSATGGTTTVANTLVVVGVSHRVDMAGPNYASWANADLASVTERFDNSDLIQNGGGLAVTTGEKATAGAFGATTAILTNASTDAFITITLKGA